MNRLPRQANSPNGTCRSPFVTGALPAKKRTNRLRAVFSLWDFFLTATGYIARQYHPLHEAP